MKGDWARKEKEEEEEEEEEMHYGPEQQEIQIKILGHSLIHSLALLTHRLAPHYPLHSRALPHSHARSLACSLIPKLVGQ